MAVVHDESLLTELWSWYGIGTLWLLLRFFVRTRSLGLRGLQLDDLSAFVVLIAWTMTCVGIHISTPIGTNIDFTEEEVDRFTDAEVRRVEYASKIYLATWYTYIVIIWGSKACVLVFFRRLRDSFDRWQQVLVGWLAWVCAAAFAATTLLLSLACRPYADNWRVRPLPPARCTSKPQGFIFQSVLNVATDAALLFVSVPLVWSLKLRPLRKLIVALLLCEGFFVITAAILRVVFTVVPNVSVPTIARWGVRELCILIICANSMILRAMFSRRFWISDQRLAAIRLRGRGLYFFRSARSERRTAGASWWQRQRQRQRQQEEEEEEGEERGRSASGKFWASVLHLSSKRSGETSGGGGGGGAPGQSCREEDKDDKINDNRSRSRSRSRSRAGSPARDVTAAAADEEKEKDIPAGGGGGGGGDHSGLAAEKKTAAAADSCHSVRFVPRCPTPRPADVVGEGSWGASASAGGREVDVEKGLCGAAHQLE